MHDFDDARRLFKMYLSGGGHGGVFALGHDDAVGGHGRLDLVQRVDGQPVREPAQAGRSHRHPPRKIFGPADPVEWEIGKSQVWC